MANIEIKKFNLRQLKKKFDEREFAIPEIQRQFVWKPKDVCKLMDSIFNNYPMGIGLIWKAPYAKAINIRPNNKTIVPPFNIKNKFAELVIDGQQRLSTIYGIIHNEPPNIEANSTINFGNIFFVCSKNAENRFIYSAKLNRDSKGYVRLSDLINTTPSVLKRKRKLTLSEYKEVDKCNKLFHSYSFYILYFDGKNFEDVKEIFIRINSGGVKVSKADTLFAKATNVNLREHLINTKRGLKNGFDNISIKRMQNTIAFAYDANEINNSSYDPFLEAVKNSKNNNKDFHKTWKQIQYGYEGAVDFLVNDLKIKSPSLLPSENIYSILAYFFYLNKSRAKRNQILEIKKWFWHTSCGGRYSGSGFNKNIPADLKFFKKLATSNTAKYIISDKIDPFDFLSTNYRKGSSVVTAYNLMLRSLNPKNLSNGQEMMLDDNSAIANRKDRHHIFPYDLLKRNSVSLKWINSIGNICYLEADANQKISNKHPCIYLQDYKKSRYFGRVMKSYLISCSTSDPIWEKSIKKAFPLFLTQRGKLILNNIEKLAGTKLFHQFTGISKT